jgi:hypothetical protein
MIHLLNFYDYSSKFPVIRVLSHDMQTNNMSNTNQLDTHTLRKFQDTLETSRIFIIPLIINLQKYY